MSAGVEAFGLMTHHTFTKLNLERIEDGTHEKAINFVNMISIFVYQIEGISKRYFLKDDKWSDKINFSILRQDYLKYLKENDDNPLLSSHNDLLKEIVSSIKLK